MVQVGTITVDGRQIGIVTQADYAPDTTAPLLGGGEMPMSAMRGDLGGDADVSSHPHHSGAKHSPYRSRGEHEHRDGIHHEGAHVRDRSKHLRDQSSGPITLGKGDDPRGLEGYIRSEAASHGVDPDTAVRVAKSEGLRDFSGDHGT